MKTPTERQSTWDLAEQRRQELRDRAQAAGWPDLEPTPLTPVINPATGKPDFRHLLVPGHFVGPGCALWGYALTDATPEQLARIDTALTQYESISRLEEAA